MRYFVLWIVALAFALLGVVVAFKVPRTAEHQWKHWCVIIGWTFLPPTWFLIEAALRIQPGGKGALNDCEMFFYDAAAKFWAAGVAVLTAVDTADAWLKP
jgi:hypothetical protein